MLIDKDDSLKTILNINHSRCLSQEDLKKWIDRVIDSHKDLTEKFGDYFISVPIQKDYPIESLSGSYCDLQCLYPSIFGDIGFDDFKHGFLDGYFSLGEKKIKTAKFLATKAQRNRMGEDQQGILLDRIANLIKNISTYRQTYITFSWHPIIFARLGHFNPDPGSCFSTKGVNWHNKFLLGQYPNSVVILWHDDPFNIKGTYVAGRCWGTFSDNLTRLDISNVYTGYSKSSFITLVEIAFNKLFQTNVKYTTRRSYFNGIYQNKESPYTFELNQTTGFKIFDIPQDPIADYRYCHYCGGKWGDVDNRKFLHRLAVCNRCIDNYNKSTGMHTCELTTDLYNGMGYRIDLDGKTYLVSSIAYEGYH